MADTTGVLARLQAALSVYDPSWDVSVGTATFKILEAVAQEIAYANNNSVLQTYSYDISTKSGAELDAFCNLFGIYRQLGKRASGTVTFSISTASTTVVNIPVGTQVSVPIGTNYTTPIIYSTTAPAIIGIGDYTVDVPVVAVLPGATGNVPSNTITNLMTTLVSVNAVNNYNPISGGLDPESDSALQNRWTSTVFSNNAGTQGKYVVTALQDPNVTLANAIGQQNFYSEQTQVISTISGTSNAGTVTFNLVAPSGVINNVTYTGSTTVASSGFLYNTNAATLASGLNVMMSGVYPSLVTSSGFSFSVSGANGTNTIASGMYISSNLASPYRLTISGSSTTSGITTFNGALASGSTYTFYDYIVSNNPDVGLSGTMSYNSVSSGYLYPQGNELLGTNLNTYNQITYANLTDYFYPTNPVAPLTITIANSANNPNLFIGNTPQLISEYNAASSRSTTLTSGNYVDIFINGTTPNTATEQIVFNPSFILLPGNATSYLNTRNYTLASGAIAATNPSVSGNFYLPLNVQPAINFPSQISSANTTSVDTIYLYNTTTSSGTTYPIAINPEQGTNVTPYPIATFTAGPVTTNQLGGYFLPVSGNMTNLIPGMILGSTNSIISGTQFYIQSITSSGVYLNKAITTTSAINTTITLTGCVAFYPLFDNTNTQNSVQSMTGLGLYVQASGINGWPAFPSSVSWATYNHSYNNDVTTVESLVQQSRPFGSNTLVHQASFVNLVVNARIVFSNGYSLSTVQSNIFNQIDNYFNNFSYLGTISFADVASQFLSSAGVANVKITSINVVALDGTLINSYQKDFILASNQLPNLYNIIYTVTGASNF